MLSGGVDSMTAGDADTDLSEAEPLPPVQPMVAIIITAAHKIRDSCDSPKTAVHFAMITHRFRRECIHVKAAARRASRRGSKT